MNRPINRVPFVVALTLLAGISLGAGETITVDTALNDSTDFGGAQTVADLPGPDGKVSLREAVTAANNTPGPQTIVFAIPQGEWSIFYTDRAVIQLDNMIYVSGADTTLDFSTQTAFTGDTNPGGNECGIAYFGPPASIPAIWLAADRCVVRGLDRGFGNNFGNTIWITGSQCRVVGCTTNGVTIRGDYGGGKSNTIGGAGPGEGNSFEEGLAVYANADDTVIVGNNIRGGLSITGDTYWGTCDNTRVGGPTAAERNSIAGYGYYSSEGFPAGTQVRVEHATGTVIENNYIGTTPDGLARFPNQRGPGGVELSYGADATIVRNNIISGFAVNGVNHAAGQRFGVAVSIIATAKNSLLVGNRIGVGADGRTIGNVQGIAVGPLSTARPTGTTVGNGTDDGGNEIAWSETTGVRVSSPVTGVRISANSIHDNAGLGIDLYPAVGAGGVSANDPGDADGGANGLQNFPVLSAAGSTGAATRIAGALDSLASQLFVVDLFSSASCDASGHGEGTIALGSIRVTTDAQGFATFSVTLPFPVAPGQAITATATHASTGNTSEFSACIGAAAVCPADIDLNGFVNGDDFDSFAAWFEAGDASADIDANGFVNGDDFDSFVASFAEGC